MKDYAKLRKLEDNELDKVSGGKDQEFYYCTRCNRSFSILDIEEHNKICKEKDQPEPEVFG